MSRLPIKRLCRRHCFAPRTFRTQQWNEAAQAWATVTASNPTNGLYWRSLADARRHTGDVAGAIVAEEHAIALGEAPTGPFTSHEEGWRFDFRPLIREIHRRGYAPCRLVSASDFDSRAKGLEAELSHLSDAQLVVEVAKLLRLVGDGHTTLLGVRRADFAWAFPLQFALFEDGLYITATDPAWTALVGAQGVALGGHPTKGYWRR